MDAWRLIEEHLPLEIRSPRGGGGSTHSSGGSSKGSGSSSSKGSSGSSGSSSKSGSSGGSTVVVVGGGSTTYHTGYGNGYTGSLPTWAVALIIWAGVIFLCLLCAMVYYCLQERKHAKSERRTFNIWHPCWRALKTVFFIAVIVEICRWIWGTCCCCFRRKPKPTGISSSTYYAKVDQEGQHDGDAWYGSSAPAAAATAYGAGGKGLSPAEDKYEPMGYAGGGAGATIAASPLNSPDPAGSADDAFSTSEEKKRPASPPPYSASSSSTTAGSAYEPPARSSTAPTPVPAYRAAADAPPALTPPAPAQQATGVPHTSPGPRYGGS